MTKKIMIIDDMIENIKFVSAIITAKTNYKILSTTSGKELFTLLKESSNIPDLFLMDIKIPDMDGFEIAKKLKQNAKTKNIPIIFVTALNDMSNKINAFNMGGVDFITKPFNKLELIARINTHLAISSVYKNLTTQNKNLKEQKDHLEDENTILETSLDIITHDTKNLFTNIKSLLKMLPESPVKDMLSDNIEDLFELSMEAVGYLKTPPRIISLVDMIKKIRIGDSRITIEDHPQITFSYSSKYLLVIESSILIKNAFINLIENALKFSPPESVTQIILQRKKNKIYFHIIDNGPGIPDDEKNKIFKRNYRTHAPHNITGSGKGLWITQNIIERASGSISVSDNINGGTIFTIELPVFKVKNYSSKLKKLSTTYNLPMNRIKEKEATIKTLIQLENMNKKLDLNSAVYANMVIFLNNEHKEKNKMHIKMLLDELKTRNPKGKTVLIADDSIYVHYYLATYFTELGYRIVNFAQNGRDVIDYYEKYKPYMIALDITMPVLSGIEAAKLILTKDSNARIIFISALGDNKKLLNTIRKKFPDKRYEILNKPLNKSQLEKVIKHLDTIN